MPVTLHIYVPLHYCCSLYKDPSLLHISVKQQQNDNSICHAISIHVPSIKMPLKCNLYATYPVHQWQKYAMHMPHLYSPESIMWPGLMYTDNDNIHNDTMPAVMCTVMSSQPNCFSWVSTWPNQPKTTKCNLNLPYICHIHTSNRYAHQMPHI